ncbi:MAG: transcriptional regulator [Halanaerobiales bacterium]|nr:transcriptional regulator [Halanaerobiales bacterium]
MQFYRIGNKVINSKYLDKTIKKILKLRQAGYSQSKVAKELKLERSFISRLESIGEVRRGNKIALVGFPIKNKEEIINTAKEFGLEYIFILTEEERWDFIKEKSGLKLFEDVIEILVKLKEYDLTIFLGSDMRLDLFDKLLDGKVIGMQIGESPIKEDIYINPEELKDILHSF